jgi:GNAT superfamily N-acetyltransferase
MTRVRAATGEDSAYLASRERIAMDELESVLRRGRVLVAEDPDRRSLVGWLRWGLFWDEVPFMNMLHVAEQRRGEGIGRLLVEAWEVRCRDAGHRTVLTSTLSSESAQHFYRRLGYQDAGCLLLPDEALEILFTKNLA